MSGSFSLIEKLAVAGAFCAMVAMAVGTEDDPGVIAESRTIRAAPHDAATASAPAPATTDYWSRQPGQPAGPDTLITPSGEPAEQLPAGFGATPSPDLPK